MLNGAITFNGINDDELITLLEGKKKHTGRLGFNPQQMQPVPGQVNTTYNNAVLTWNGEEGLRAVLEVLTKLLKEEEDKHNEP